MGGEVTAELEWKPELFYCENCEEVIYSVRPGQYDECGCGNSFVDQTRDYIRVGGSARPVGDKLAEEQKKKESKPMTYVKFRKKISKMVKELAQPPYHRHFRIDFAGCFEVLEETHLQPEEAYRLGRWLVEFYEGAEDVDTTENLLD